MHQVYFIRENRKIEVPEGTTVLEAQRLAGLRPDAPCGGAGTCGKCRVVINGRNRTGLPDKCQGRSRGGYRSLLFV